MSVVNRKARLVGLVTFVIIVLIILFIVSKTINYVNRPREEVQNVGVKDDRFNLNINGDYVTYVEVNDKYVDEGAKAYIDNRNISDNIITSYYQNGTQVSSIKTDKSSTYIVKYEVSSNGENKEKTRVVIVTDTKSPNLVVPDTVTITSDEAISYDVDSGVSVTDNAGVASFECENTLMGISGNYVIKCIAKDENGNKTERNRLIKVVNGIEFKYDGQLTIRFPINSKKNYTYKYSIDNGITWIDALDTEVLDVESGNVIALVLENGNYKMSSTYYVK